MLVYVNGYCKEESYYTFLIKVMTAASYWSLLAPAIEMASQSNFYGKDGQYAFVPVSIGFLLGAAFVHYADVLMTYLVSP